MTLSPEQRRLARHALGLRDGQRKSYRNHFAAPEGSKSHGDWVEMVTVGIARGAGHPDCFKLTRAGADAALDAGETLCGEDFPLMRQAA